MPIRVKKNRRNSIINVQSNITLKPKLKEVLIANNKIKILEYDYFMLQYKNTIIKC